MRKFVFIFLLIHHIYQPSVYSKRLRQDYVDNYLLNQDDSTWPGRWFPEKPAEPVKTYGIPEISKDSDPVDFQYLEDPPKGMDMMAMVNPICDDGKTNIEVDWPKTPANYTCVSYMKKYFWPDPDLPPIIHKSFIPTAYKARHICMNEEITYPTDIPTFGPHRPAWPRFGEYKFLPRQRWMHSLEHGAVVMLYHPCAHPFVVKQVKDIVKSCLRRHIITPYTLLPHNRPIALVTWGWYLLLPDINEKVIKDFIKEHALHGPEEISKDGQYDFKLIEHAKIITTIDDKGGICAKKSHY